MLWGLLRRPIEVADHRCVVALGRQRFQGVRPTFRRRAHLQGVIEWAQHAKTGLLTHSSLGSAPATCVPHSAISSPGFGPVSHKPSPGHQDHCLSAKPATANGNTRLGLRCTVLYAFVCRERGRLYAHQLTSRFGRCARWHPGTCWGQTAPSRLARPVAHCCATGITRMRQVSAAHDIGQ